MENILNCSINPLIPKSDQHEISPYYINALENRVVMRIEYMIKKDESDILTMRFFTAGMPPKLNSIQLRRQRDSNFYSRRGEDIYDDGNRPRPGCKHPIHSRTSESLRRANKCGLLDVRFHG